MVARFGVEPVSLERRSAEGGAAVVKAPKIRGMPPPAVRVERFAHVESAQNEDDCASARKALKEALSGEPLYERHVGYCEDAVLRRFLTARNNDTEKAKRLLLDALEWREQYLPNSHDYDELERTARNGVMRVTGLDVHERAVVVFDGSVQQLGDHLAQLRFIAFNLEHAARRMEGSRVEKCVIFMHLADFSLSNCPPRVLVKDACAMLTKCFPERCGNLVFHQAPSLFSGIFRLCKPFVDPRTAAKFVFVVGDDAPGSQNDSTLREVIGPRWRELTGVGAARELSWSSPGYAHGRDWGAMLSYEYAWYLRDVDAQDFAGVPNPRSAAGHAAGEVVVREDFDVAPTLPTLRSVHAKSPELVDAGLANANLCSAAAIAARTMAMAGTRVAEALWIPQTSARARAGANAPTMVRATATGAFGGGAMLGAACAAGGMMVGCTMGALVGTVAAPFTFGFSILLGASVGSGTGLCVGAAAGGVAGSWGGAAVGLVGYAFQSPIAAAVNSIWLQSRLTNGRGLRSEHGGS
eukprot:CAMPEP_0117575138 /NCGR_PEP_ID=MMETSP0784-20121206/62039_1 /TAXON_ID=39447 /ORGANISM="" /LENGTH=523 /DNA_ID=CAMNT_0005374173 /DNA_START=73 /DNA_END=1644 /DNA_ORIENTATION=+